MGGSSAQSHASFSLQSLSKVASVGKNVNKDTSPLKIISEKKAPLNIYRRDVMRVDEDGAAAFLYI